MLTYYSKQFKKAVFSSSFMDDIFSISLINKWLIYINFSVDFLMQILVLFIVFLFKSGESLPNPGDNSYLLTQKQSKSASKQLPY